MHLRPEGRGGSLFDEVFFAFLVKSLFVVCVVDREGGRASRGRRRREFPADGLGWGLRRGTSVSAAAIHGTLEQDLRFDRGLYLG